MRLHQAVDTTPEAEFLGMTRSAYNNSRYGFIVSCAVANHVCCRNLIIELRSSASTICMACSRSAAYAIKVNYIDPYNVSRSTCWFRRRMTLMAAPTKNKILTRLPNQAHQTKRPRYHTSPLYAEEVSKISAFQPRLIIKIPICPFQMLSGLVEH
jgi:hypothetical protein